MKRASHKPKQRAGATAKKAAPAFSFATNVTRMKLLLVVLVVVVASFFLLGGITRVTNQFTANAIQQRDLRSAKSWIQFTSKLQSTNPLNCFHAARVARVEGDWPMMDEHLVLAAKAGFDRDRVELERKLSFAQSGRLDEVEAELSERLAHSDPDSAEICEAYANGLAMASRFEAAIKILDAWRIDRPNDPRPAFRMARIQEHLQQLENAKASYEKSIAIDGEYYPALYSLARMLLDGNEAEQSVALFNRCLKMDRPEAAKVGLGMSYAKLGDSAKAKQFLIEAQTADPGLVRESYAALGEAVERNLAAAELGKLLTTEGDFAEGLRMLEVALQENPRDLTARYSLALALKGLGRNEEANVEFAKVEETKQALAQVNVLRNQINRNDEDTESRIALGKLLVQYESERSGLFWLKSALQHGDNDPNVHRALAEYYETHRNESPSFAELASQHRAKVAALESK